MGFELIAEGEITSTPTPQLLVDLTGNGRYSGYLDLTNMEVNDVVTLIQYIMINGVFVSYRTQQYGGVQSDPLLYIEPKECVTQIKLTLQQNTGPSRLYPYIFILESDNDLSDMLQRALGLAQENYFLDQTVYANYQGTPIMTGGRIRIYSDKASVGTNNNVIATYNVSATYSQNKLQTYKVTMV